MYRPYTSERIYIDNRDVCVCVCGHHSCQFSKVIRQHINICIYVVDTVAKQTPALSSLLSAVLLFEEEEQQQFCFGVEQCEHRDIEKNQS